MAAHEKGFAVPETAVINLAPSNRNSILDASSQVALERKPEAEVILNRLKELNLNLAEQFRYKETALDNLTFRLICSSDAPCVKDPTAPVPSFLAISYCWHKEPGDEYYWEVAGPAQPLTRWGLSQPIVRAILDLRAEDEGVWVDQLCIDQNDKNDKDAQIGSMDIIYRAARRLVVALEDVQLDAKEGEVGKRYYAMYLNMCQEVKKKQPSDTEKLEMIAELFSHDPSDVEASNQFISKMVNARWFSRAWCAHECKVNPQGRVNNPLFLCFDSNDGVVSFEYRFLHFFATHVQSTYPKVYPMRRLFEALEAPTKENILIRAATIIDSLTAAIRLQDSLMMHLTRLEDFGCQLKTDLMSIALNFTRIPLTFVADPDVDLKFDRPERRTWIFAMLALASGDLQPLLLWARQLDIIDPRTQSKAISWFDLPHTASIAPRVQGVPSTLPSIHSATLEYIELDLYLFPAIPQPASADSLMKARRVIERYHLHDKCHISGSQDTSSLPGSGLQQIQLMREQGLDIKWLEQVLGCAVDGGIAWVRNLPLVLEAETKSGSWEYGTFDSSSPNLAFRAAAEELLSSFYITRKFVAASFPSMLASLPPEDAKGWTADKLYEQEFLSPTLKFLTCITDYRLRFPFRAPRRLTTRPQGATNDSFADSAFTELPSDRSYIAVPVALAHLPFWEKRAWVVEPGERQFEPDWRWRGGGREKRTVNIRELWPVLTADFGDRREGWDGREGGTWNLRRRQPLMGCEKLVESEACILLKRQRVYGGRDYKWDQMEKMRGRWPADWKSYVKSPSDNSSERS